MFACNLAYQTEFSDDNVINELSSKDRYTSVKAANSILTTAMSENSMSVAKPEEFMMQHSSKQLGQLTIHELEFSTETCIDIDDTGNYYYIQLPMLGEMQVTQQAHNARAKAANIITADKYHGFILNPQHQHRLELNGNCQQRIVQIPADIVERQLTDLMGCSMSRPLKFDLDMQCKNGKTDSWWRNIQYLSFELARADSMFYNKSIADEMNRVIISALLQGQYHNYSDALDARHSSIAPGHVHRAETYIKENVYEEISVDSIVEAAKVKKRTLYDGFKRFRGISPICYLQNLRLDLAREEFLHSGYDTNITCIAMKLGFNHLGRFSISYKKRFGESPSITLQRHQ